jgi:hypothetical protein
MMRSKFPAGERVVMTRRHWLAGAALVVVVAVGSTASLLVYKCSSTKVAKVNAYYARLLERRELTGVAGPHFWKGGRLFWAGDRYLESSSDFGRTATDEIALPATWSGPARFVSDSILADRRNVYVKIGDQFQTVLSEFGCWYICGSRLRSGDFVIGEYGNQIYRLNAKTGEATLIFEKPPEARHFHVTAVDPFTNDIYTSLGDALKKYQGFGDRVTGIMRSQDGGETWEWIYRTIVGAGEIDRQPTAVYFERDKIYFGTDSKPHGIFILDRKTGAFEQVFEMNDFFHSWFTTIERAKGSYWAVSRAFSNKGFGVLWWSADAKDWSPIQMFHGTPVWLETSEPDDLLSVGFVERDLNVVTFKLPDATEMTRWVSHGPSITMLDRLVQSQLFEKEARLKSAFLE